MNGSVDITYHYPPELFNLLVDTIPLLNRSKNDVLTFFRGAGVQAGMLDDLAGRLRTTPKEINKYEITRQVLGRLNDRGEACLRERREVLRRVVEFTNFDSCWPTDQLKVKGLVASVREIVNQKDALWYPASVYFAAPLPASAQHARKWLGRPLCWPSMRLSTTRTPVSSRLPFLVRLMCTRRSGYRRSRANVTTLRRR